MSIRHELILHINRVQMWRRGRRRRCFEAWARLILPSAQIRSQIFRRLRRWAWFRRFMASKLGMVFFDRIVTPKWSMTEATLKTFATDIRQILSDNALRDVDDELFLMVAQK